MCAINRQETSVKTTEFTLVLGAAPEAFKDELSGTDAKRSIKLEGDTLIQVAITWFSYLTCFFFKIHFQDCRGWQWHYHRGPHH